MVNTQAHKAKTGKAEIIQDFTFMISGCVITSFSLKSFLVPNDFFDGGVTGISLLVHHELRHINFALILFLFNLPLIITSFYTVGKNFAFRMCIAVVLVGICLELIPAYALTQDKLLISIFGGVFLGIGIGLVMRAGSALDGIEVLALFTLKRTSFTISEIILAINVLIFTVAAVGIGIENALYSILTYFCASRTIDYVVEGLQAYTG
ncbi:MAG: YitT family protein, partial [Chitinophagaceae bacterium]